MPDELLRLKDLLEAIDGVGAMLRGISFAHFYADLRTRRAVERCIEIASEAWRRVPNELKPPVPSPHAAELVSIGVLMRHEYRRVDANAVWRIATRSLPEMRPMIADMANRLEADFREQVEE